jgi:hypothetical protein
LLFRAFDIRDKFFYETTHSFDNTVLFSRKEEGDKPKLTRNNLNILNSMIIEIIPRLELKALSLHIAKKEKVVVIKEKK